MRRQLRLMIRGRRHQAVPYKNDQQGNMLNDMRKTGNGFEWNLILLTPYVLLSDLSEKDKVFCVEDKACGDYHTWQDKIWIWVHKRYVVALPQNLLVKQYMITWFNLRSNMVMVHFLVWKENPLLVVFLSLCLADSCRHISCQYGLLSYGPGG